MRLWYGALYYGEESTQFKAVIRVTGLSSEQLKTLFAPTGKFGTVHTTIRTEIKQKWNCEGDFCSEYEIAVWQFLNAEFTKSIIDKYSNKYDYLVPKDSVLDWGYNRGVKLEYSSFSQEPLTWQQYDIVANWMTGLCEMDNMFEFVIDVST